ncbi:MAG: DUF4124 domain-containing protein [Chromatiales bacterium]|nr:DUF4124 domain-containing protein [Chromatiales bacterium]
MRIPHLIAIVLLPLTAAFTPAPGQAAVYRCDLEDGRIVFQETACSDGGQVKLDGHGAPKVGWSASAKDYRTGTWSPPAVKKSARSGAGAAEKRRIAERCHSREARLERIESTMRRGYKAGQGTKLRAQRRELERYLREFCS